MVSRQLRFQEYPQCAQKYPKKVQFLERIVFQKNLNGHADFSCMRQSCNHTCYELLFPLLCFIAQL